MNEVQRMNDFRKIAPSLITDNQFFMDWLIDNGFFSAPASTRFHGAYNGGLYDHSKNVYIRLQEMTDKLGLSWMRPESPFVVGMFHDLCKIDLLPVLPLDGGRMVFCVGYYVFPIAALTKALSMGGVIAGLLMAALSVYGAIAWGKLNLSLLLVGGYLVVYACRNRSILWSENLYALLQERRGDEKMPMAVKLYEAAPEMRLLSFVDAIADSRAALFRIGERWVDEKQVIRALMRNPHATAAEMLEKADNFHENDGKCLQHQPL